MRRRTLLLSTCLLIPGAARAQANGSLGTPLKQDGYSIRPPQGFRTARKELFTGTRVGAIALEPVANRALSAALMDADDESASTMLVSWVDEPFSPGPSARDGFATAVVRHFAEELGLKLSLETARGVGGEAPRIEIFGTLKQEAQVRRVLIAAFEGDARHVVVMFSVPSGRFDELRDAMTASLESFRVDAPTNQGLSRGLVGALAGAALGALIVSWSLWRNQRKRAAER